MDNVPYLLFRGGCFAEKKKLLMYIWKLQWLNKKKTIIDHNSGSDVPLFNSNGFTTAAIGSMCVRARDHSHQWSGGKPCPPGLEAQRNSR